MQGKHDLNKAGLKTTQPRLKILDVLETSPVRHLSAEDVYKRLLELDQVIGLATVYRVLTQFESAGLIIRHNFEGGASVFELNDASHHDHMVCIKCNKVFEFFDSTIEQRNEKLQKNLALSCRTILYIFMAYAEVCRNAVSARCKVPYDCF